MKKIFILSMFLFVLFFSFSINLTSMNHNQIDEYYVYVPYNTSVKGSNSTKAFRPHAFFLNLDITPYLYY